MANQLIPVSIGVFCHNEENNVGHALESLLAAKTTLIKIKQIIVVSSGSFDRTNRIVRKFATSDRRIHLIDEAQRSGKTSAINQFLKRATGSVLVSVSGDVRVRSDALDEIVQPFLNPQVGMVGAHPIPMNTRFSQVGEEAKLLWELHHLVSLRQAKCGEMIAFRNVISQLPADSSVDEATLEVLLKLIGFTVIYAPRSVVYNKVPLTRSEFIMRRRTIETGHLLLGERYNYQVSTMNREVLTSVLWDYFLANPKSIKVIISLLALEILSRLLGWIDFKLFKKNPIIWKMARR